MINSPLSQVLNRIGSITHSEPKRHGNGWTSLCPAHDDRDPSLSIAEGDDGRVLLCCHAGCSAKDVVAALEMTMANLMPERHAAKRTNDNRQRNEHANTHSFAKKRRYSSAELAIEILTRKRGQPAGQWKYHDKDGVVVCHVLRWNKAGDKKDFLPITRCGDGWSVAAMKAPRPIYRLPEVQSATRVHIPEGEKCADVMVALGLIATTTAGGAKAVFLNDFSPLAEKDIVIFPDNDLAGQKYADGVTGQLFSLNPNVRIRVVNLPDLPPGGDIVDFVEACHADGKSDEDIKAAIERMVTEALLVEQPTDGEPKRDKERTSCADKLVKLATEHADLWHTPDGQESEAFATIQVGDHVESWPIASLGFQRWLSHRYYVRRSGAPSGNALTEAMNIITAIALFEGTEHKAHLRVAEHGGAVFVNLGNQQWQVVRINNDGWQIIDGHESPVRFTRRRGMLAFPAPERGGRIDELRSFVNLPDDDGWLLVLAWIVAAFVRGPYAVLSVNGEQGCAKSTLCKVVRHLIDPNSAPLRRPPKDERDLIIATSNSLLVAFDNLSGIPGTLSDALCALATGSGFSTRELYSNGEEKLFAAMRPIIINGIDELGTRSDLLDRSLAITLPVIDEGARRTEAEFWAAFEIARPRILGAIFDAVSIALRNIPEVKFDRLPRMADFATIAIAAAPAFGVDGRTMLAAFESNRNTVTEQAIEASAIGPIMVNFVANEAPWSGTATELLDMLSSRYATDDLCKRRDWPRTAKAVASSLRRIAPNLRAHGISVRFHKPEGHAKRRIIEIRAL